MLKSLISAFFCSLGFHGFQLHVNSEGGAFVDCPHCSRVHNFTPSEIEDLFE